MERPSDDEKIRDCYTFMDPGHGFDYLGPLFNEFMTDRRFRTFVLQEDVFDIFWDKIFKRALARGDKYIPRFFDRRLPDFEKIYGSPRYFYEDKEFDLFGEMTFPEFAMEEYNKFNETEIRVETFPFPYEMKIRSYYFGSWNAGDGEVQYEFQGESLVPDHVPFNKHDRNFTYVYYIHLDEDSTWGGNGNDDEFPYLVDIVVDIEYDEDNLQPWSGSSLIRHAKFHYDIVNDMEENPKIKKALQNEPCWSYMWRAADSDTLEALQKFNVNITYKIEAVIGGNVYILTEQFSLTDMLDLYGHLLEKLGILLKEKKFQRGSYIEINVTIG